MKTGDSDLKLSANTKASLGSGLRKRMVMLAKKAGAVLFVLFFVHILLMFGSLILIGLHGAYDWATAEEPNSAGVEHYALHRSDEVVEFTPPERTERADVIERLSIDVKLSTWGVLTVTETLTVPPQQTALPEEGGFTRVLRTAPQDIHQPDSLVAPATVTPGTRAFKLDVIAATCDGEDVPYTLHEYERAVRFCVGPPEDADKTSAHVYSVTYATTSDVHYPVWRMARYVWFKALENEYGRPVEFVDIRFELPDGTVLDGEDVVGSTGGRWTKGHTPGGRIFDMNHIENFEISFTDSHVVEIKNIRPFLPKERLTLLVDMPRSTLWEAYSVEILEDFSNGLYNIFYWFYIALASAFALALAVAFPWAILESIRDTPEIRAARKAKYEKEHPPEE
jgi:hypothetical protein